MRCFFGFALFILACGCEQKPCVVNVPAPAIVEKYKFMEGTYWTTSKAGTVLQVKTMFRINTETGEADYLKESAWYVTN